MIELSFNRLFYLNLSLKFKLSQQNGLKQRQFQLTFSKLIGRASILIENVQNCIDTINFWMDFVIFDDLINILKVYFVGLI